MVIHWDTFSDFENKNVSVRICNGMNDTEGKMPFDEIKKNFYAKFKNDGKAA